MKLSEVCDFQNGYAFKSKDFIQDGKYKVIKIKELKDGIVRFFDNSATILDIDESKKRYIVEKDDILFALTGDPVSKNNPLSWVGRVSKYYNDEDALLNQRVCKLIPNDSVDKDFIYYYFREFDNFHGLAQKATGSASQANISTKQIGDVEIDFPSLNQQKAISGILRSFDEKIEVNKKINHHLLEQARALYRNMIETSVTEVVKLNSIADIVMGQSPKGDTYNDLKLGLPLINGATDFRGNINPSKWTSDPKKIAKSGDYIFGVRATIGLTTRVFDNYAIGRGTGSATPKTAELDEFLFFVLEDLFDYYSNSGSGTVYVNISKNDFEKFELKLPCMNRIEEYHFLAKPLMDMRYTNEAEILRLQKIRDTLLPKLMSGEISVSQATK
ncbi:restriction endonuclease subunit S [Lactococcus lactis subsp. lactis]|uniref:restriction endonuclease subunit S n=1 Tax=Lactococcus lactis TaxID=1358 RepID=UPI00294125F2|nr:restriction endonuclease subunit S [Lactococcus lactis]MDV4192657.1 restriction endonuclease subunit S [Lactococcus lactis subsp. lactis]